MTKLKDKLWDNVNLLQKGLKDKGFDIGNTQSCVTPVYLKGSIPEAMVLVRDLRENHQIFCSIVVYPVIPKGLILLRLIPTASHTIEDINLTLDAFGEIRKKLEKGIYKKISSKIQASQIYSFNIRGITNIVISSFLLAVFSGLMIPALFG